MPGDHQYVFVSYARADLERVRPLVDGVRAELAAEDAGWQKKLAQGLSAAGFALRRRA